MRHDEAMRDYWQQCVDWNNAHPLGTTVRYQVAADMPVREYVTTSDAYVLPSGQRVVGLGGVAYPVPLDRIVAKD